MARKYIFVGIFCCPCTVSQSGFPAITQSWELWQERLIWGIANIFQPTRMHSSRMHTACSLTVSHRKNHACPPRATMHAPRSNHAHPPGATMHAPPGATTHAPPGSNHAHPPSNHAPPGATTHAPPEQPHMPPRSNHAHPPWATMHAPPVDRMTDTCENITFSNFVCGR